MTVEFIPYSQLGVVRNHDSIDFFASQLIAMGAVNITSAVSAGQIIEYTGMGVKSVYNKLTRPGFVKVTRETGGTNHFYYLVTEFVPLANAQGARNYPKHLGPLADRKIKRLESISADNFIVEVTSGDIEVSDRDKTPVVVRAVSISDTDVIKGMGVDTEQLLSLFSNPVLNADSLSTVLVVLAGLYRWVERFRTYDAEKQKYITDAIEAREDEKNDG